MGVLSDRDQILVEEESLAVPKSVIEAAGDLIYGSADDTPTRLPAGSDGQVLTLASGLPSWAAGASAPLTLTSTATSMIPLTVKGAAGQTANLQEWQNSAGAVLASVSAAGYVYTTAVFATTASSLTLGSSAGSNYPVYIDAQNVHVATFRAIPGAGEAHSLFSTVQTDKPSVVVKGAAAQTANLQEWKDSAGTVLASVTAAGLHKWASGNEQTSVGAAGAASALPASPTKYLKVVGSDGTTYVVPAFLAA